MSIDEAVGFVDPSDPDYLEQLVASGDAPTVLRVVDESWASIDLRSVLAGNFQQPTPTVGATMCGQRALSYRAAVNGMHADSGTGKGFVWSLKAKQILDAGGRVLVLDYEDTPVSIAARLRLIGCDPGSIAERFDYRRPRDPWTPTVTAMLVDVVRSAPIDYVVIDSIGEAFAIEGVNEDRDNEVGPFYAQNVRPLAEAGACVDVIDHSTKAEGTHFHPSGSKRKRAAITGASYWVRPIKPLVKERGGQLALICAKDRHGNYARGQEVARFVMSYDDAGDMAVAFDVPASTRTPPPVDGLDATEQRTLETIQALAQSSVDKPVPVGDVKERARRPKSTNRDAITRPGIDEALERLADSGHITHDGTAVALTDTGLEHLRGDST